MNRKNLIKKLDRVVADVVKKRDDFRCVGHIYKGYSGYVDKYYLTPSHYFGRRYLGTRWLMDNLITLCVECHTQWEHEKNEGGVYYEYMYGKFGKEKMKVMYDLAHGIAKYSISDLRKILLQYT